MTRVAPHTTKNHKTLRFFTLLFFLKDWKLHFQSYCMMKNSCQKARKSKERGRNLQHISKSCFSVSGLICPASFLVAGSFPVFGQTKSGFLVFGPTLFWFKLCFLVFGLIYPQSFAVFSDTKYTSFRHVFVEFGIYIFFVAGACFFPVSLFFPNYLFFTLISLPRTGSSQNTDRCALLDNRKL